MPVMTATKIITAPSKQTRPETQLPRLWNVVLLDDDDHTYQYVMEMTQRLFAFSPEKAFLAAKKVDQDGRVICRTCHRELAELKVEQIRGYGRDVLIASCTGSMKALIEPAESPEDGGE